MKLHIKAALFLFALGLGGSLAHARPTCQEQCRLDYKACLAKHPGSLECKDDWIDCRHDCADPS